MPLPPMGVWHYYYNTTKGEFQVNMKKNFWFISLVAFWIIGASTGWSLWIRIAVAANALVVLFEVAKELWRLSHGKQKKKN